MVVLLDSNDIESVVGTTRSRNAFHNLLLLCTINLNDAAEIDFEHSSETVIDILAMTCNHATSHGSKEHMKLELDH